MIVGTLCLSFVVKRFTFINTSNALWKLPFMSFVLIEIMFEFFTLMIVMFLKLIWKKERFTPLTCWL